MTGHSVRIEADTGGIVSPSRAASAISAHDGPPARAVSSTPSTAVALASASGMSTRVCPSRSTRRPCGIAATPAAIATVPATAPASAKGRPSARSSRM